MLVRVQRQDWGALDPTKMLAYCRDEDLLPSRQGRPLLTARKLRLFACACCRHPSVWPLLTDSRSRNAVAVAERFADGQATGYNLYDALRGAQAAWPVSDMAAGLARTCCAANPLAIVERVTLFKPDELPPESQADLLRSIVNPFAPPLLPECRTPLVVSLAEAAYSERREDGTLDPERLAVLSDALEEAGVPGEVRCSVCATLGWRYSCIPCEGTGRVPHPLLASLRSKGPHYRGLWSLDLCLGRE